MDMSVIGPVTVMDSFTHQFGEKSPIVHGIIISSILLSAAVSAMFAGRPADSFGRPKAIALGAGVFTIGAILQASAVNLVMFAVGRVVEGFGYGLYFGTKTVCKEHLCLGEGEGLISINRHLRDCSTQDQRHAHDLAPVSSMHGAHWRLLH